ncbi:MAG TPA: protein-export chaperone SecB [Ferruginibacter sp.]|jgi:preprotein translocase subunit SecB|nr:protein-export chaperone SecB [Ferruginibacter sp.]
MEQEIVENIESGFKVTNIILMASSFRREYVITFDPAQIGHEVNIDVNVLVDNNKIAVTESLLFKQVRGIDKTVEIEATVSMVGIFESVGTPTIDPNEFGNVNGAAIIFPYLREVLSSMCVKAGAAHIILHPYNFTRHKNKSEEDVKDNEERKPVKE